MAGFVTWRFIMIFSPRSVLSRSGRREKINRLEITHFVGNSFYYSPKITTTALYAFVLAPSLHRPFFFSFFFFFFFPPLSASTYVVYATQLTSSRTRANDYEFSFEAAIVSLSAEVHAG